MTWEKGQSGNPGGRKKGSKSPITYLEEAVARSDEKKKIALVDHYVARAYKNDAVLISIYKKFIPDLKQIDGNIEGKSLNLLSISLNPEFQSLIQSFLGQMARLELDKGKPKVLVEGEKTDLPVKEGEEKPDRQM